MQQDGKQRRSTAAPSPAVCSTNDEEEDALTQSERQFGSGEELADAADDQNLSAEYEESGGEAHEDERKCVCVQPLMREALENKVEITKQEARDLVERCLKVLYYRDARSYNRHEIAIVTEEGVEIIGPLSSETNWDIAHMVSGFE
ncbi:proteasome subunit beta type-4 [Morone saxatilis]|uniref:proteasome subunit beta type-4 n=1 Tax=Morone saxatilis TaxID=34816 RepID=UPI0015E218A7|nr:proteasome subunit beta type-4 [Morone saxatilis]